MSLKGCNFREGIGIEQLFFSSYVICIYCLIVLSLLTMYFLVCL